MDYLQIGNLSFERNASKSDMRLDFCSAFQEAALDCGDLAFDTLKAEVFTNTVGPQLSALAANIPVVVYRNNAVYARFVKLTVSRIAPNSYRITGRSPMGALTVMPHTGGIYTEQTAEDVVKEICGNIPVLVETIFSNFRLYGWLPYADGKEKSARDNLAQVLFAIGAYLRTDLNGTLRIEKAWSGTASAIPADRSYSGGTINYDLPVSSVSVAEHQYVEGTDEKELFSGTAQAGDIVTFSEPMHSLTAEGFTILESNANYAKLSAGTGTLTGKTYTHNTRLVTRTVTAGAAENVVSVTDATLVSLVNSAAVANRLAEYYKHRETISNGIIAGAEKPGHVVSIYHPYDKKMVSACVESLDTTMSATLKSNLAALVGFIPPQPETSEYYDERVVLTGSGTWTVPEGITEIRAVLIGGGQGGKHGADGETDPVQDVRTSTEDYTDSTWRYVFVRYSPGGEGGASGEPGMGGKVLVQSLSNLTSGGIIAYSCGIGGAGATDAAAAGTNGTATTFGSLSSDSGSSSDGGYTDTTTGEVFAAKGAAGIPGSRGRGKEFVEGTGYVVVESPSITVGDVTYVAGADNSASIDDGNGNWQTAPYGYLGYEWAGGLGGGAAYGNNGNAATGSGNGYVDVSRGYASVRSAPGGEGANAAAPPKATRYGSGGTGGNGGGGAGGSGVANARQTVSKAISSQTAELKATQTRSKGGLGSAGGEGADGCIIIYYRRPKPIQPGWVKDKNGKPLLERLNKRLIV